MITISKIENSNNIAKVELYGLSTDEKPTKMGDNNIANGSLFIEVDTGKFYLYDLENEQWHEV